MYRLNTCESRTLRRRVQIALVRALYREGKLNEARFSQLLAWCRES